MNYLTWLNKETRTDWWHDSGDPSELASALTNGAVGVTTNPVLAYRALAANRSHWRDEIREAVSENEDPGRRAEALTRIVVTHAASALEETYRVSGGSNGYVCAQVSPEIAGDRAAMMETARRYAEWAPNVAVKVPVTAAGLDVMKDLCSSGVTVTCTVSFSVPQAISVAKSYQEVVDRMTGGNRPGRCFAVIMIGRLDDYLRDVFLDTRARINEASVRTAGIAAVKKLYSLFRERDYAARLMVAALRGNYHMSELAGANLVMSIHPKHQANILGAGLAHEERVDVPAEPDALDSLLTHHEFRRAYDENGLDEDTLFSYGPTQRTLTQFSEGGWKLLENFDAQV